MKLDSDLQSLQTVRELLRRADRAQKEYARFDQSAVDRVVAAMAGEISRHVAVLAEMAVEETGLGRVADKITKNRFAAEQVYDAIREQQTVGVVREDPNLKLVEIAVPMGVVAGIIPTTNPTSTTIFKALIALKSRNGIVFSPHPSARKCICRTADILHEAAVRAGAPEGIIGCIAEPTMAATQELMGHPLTAVILATGGHGLVRAAYSSGKPAFGVGPGNVPAFIERTAEVAEAVRLVLAGKCFDNGTVCASEQAVIVDRPAIEVAREEFRRRRAHFCSPEEKARLEQVMVVGGGINPAMVGRSAVTIASVAGFSVPEDTSALVVECRGVGSDEPLSREKLSPVLSFYEVDGWLAGCELCIRLLEYGGLGHTMVIHSRDEDIIMKFALEKPAFRIIVNSSGTHGAIGFSTGLTPSLTLGCGTWGNNITTDNITATHLVNIKRLAYGIRPVPEEGRQESSPVPPPRKAIPQREEIRHLVEKTLRDFMRESGSAPAEKPETTAEPVTPPEKAAKVVTEEDVRAALRGRQKIVVDQFSRITPAARELGERHGLFSWRE